jgi:hypothetical protein
VSFASRVREWFQPGGQQPVLEAATPGPARIPERRGFEYGIPTGGINEYSQGMGAATQTDRRSLLQQLYEAYLACPWAYASVNAIARTITAGGLVTDWDGDDGEGDQDTPDKPPNVLALERLLGYCNPNEDIRQLMRNVITDLEVFGDAFLEVVWWGDLPVALYSLDAPTMAPIADEHGVVTGYVQVTEFGQRAEFEARDVIHIALDAPRSSVFGVSPTQAALLPITSWLFAASTGKEMFRKGLPPTVHVDFPAGAAQPEINKWVAQYQAQNIGPRNIGRPMVTKGNATAHELASGRVADVESFLSQKRDEIAACYGVPPAKIGIVESGNIGGGTGESQDKTFRVNTCDPLGQLVLEKLNFHIVANGFGVEGWHLKFADIDMRDSKTVEEIRDMRLRNGSWVLNKYRAEIGEPPVEGGNDAVLVDRQNIVMWNDMDAMSKAGIALKLKGTALEPDEPSAGKGVTLLKPEPAPVPDALKAFAGQDNPAKDGQPPGAPVAPGTPPPDGEVPAAESWAARQSAYRSRLREALACLPGVEEFDERAA